MSDQELAHAVAVIDDVWEEERQAPWVMFNGGHQVLRLPDVSEEAMHASSERARCLLARIDSLEPLRLPADLGNTIAVARAAMHRQSLRGPWFWTVFDPLGIGFWAPYAPTAYGGGWLLSESFKVFDGQPLDDAGDEDRYLALVDDFARLVGQLDARTRGQAARGIHLPRVQLEQAVPLMKRLQAAACTRLTRGEGPVRARVQQRVKQVVTPAFEAFLAWLSDPERRSLAPEDVGMAHLPSGAAIYAELVSQHLTLDVSIESVHAFGLDRLAEIDVAMQRIAEELGEGDAQAVVRRLDGDETWHADTTEGVAQVFQRYIDRMKPHVGSQFRFQPTADYGVEALPDALSASMTFGFYDKPHAGEPKGRYLFNAGNLTRQSLANVAALTFHELVPGHHLHFASQAENQDLHPLRGHAMINAFNEGWAEYASGLADELGLYELPEERFGRLMMDAFLTTRLVVDTGMNALGWPLEQARDFMREHAFVSEAEVLSESIRYSCDIPGQSLAYKMGEPFLLEQRERMRQATGAAFDIRDFHDAVLRPGGLPLTAVANNIDRAIARALSEVDSLRPLSYAAPQGPYPVGVCDGEFVDTTYPTLRVEDAGGRRVMVRVWYHAAGSGGQRRPYFSDAEAAVLGVGMTGDKPGLVPREWMTRLGDVLTHGLVDADVDAGLFPTLLFSHGLLSYVSQNTPLMEHLASNGYVVFSVTHPGESGGIVYPNGDLVTLDESISTLFAQKAADPAVFDKLSADIGKRLEATRRTLDERGVGPWSQRWVDDMRALIDALESGALTGPAAAVVAACDLDRIGVLGMSFGAAAATSTAQADTRVKAAVSLDGGQCLSDLLDTDVRVPLLELSSDIVARMTGLGIDAHLIEYNEFFFETLRTAGTREDVTRVLIPDVLHIELTDFLLLPASERAEALPGGGKADGPRVIALLNGFVGGYFDSVLKCENNGYPKAQLDEFPETRTIDLTAIRTWAEG